eukprot:gene3830-15123_t
MAQSKEPQPLMLPPLRCGEVRLMFNNEFSIATSVDVLRRADAGSLLHNIYLWIVREHYKTMSAEYYVDRHPGGIQHIINFLRDGSLPSNIFEDDQLRTWIKEDAIFYELKTMLKKIDDTVDKSPKNN